MSEATTIKEGWLLKRGEYIASWRPRYFILKSDGQFKGFRGEPKSDTEAPINYFDIINSSINPDDAHAKKGKWGFNITFRQVNRQIERAFHLEDQSARDEWMKAYETVKQMQGTEVTRREVGGRSGADAGAVRSRAYTHAKGVMVPTEMDISHFEMLKVLGKGTFGKVMLAKQKTTQSIFAIKILKKSMVLEKDELAHTLTENSVLAKCHHPFLTELRYSFQTDELLCFVLEYVNGGEVFFHLSKDRRFSENRTKFYIAEISSAIHYLHCEGIIYRDLKLENLMLDREGHIKITDFGLCKEEIHKGDATTTFCGTPEYLAPEVIEDSDYGQSVDWWGVGVVCFEMISGQLPFRSRDHEELFGLILTQPLKVPPFFSPNAKDLVTQLLNKDCSARLCSGETGGEELMNHPFFADIDWAQLDAKAIPPPFVPVIKSETDTSNFDTFFTKEAAIVTPPDAETPLTSGDKKKTAFKDFKTV